jgi:hypothetical protein
MTRQIGAALLVLVVAAVAAYQMLSKRPGAISEKSRGAAVTVKGSIGGEKTGLLKDPEVVAALRQRYGLTVDASRAGSLDIVRSAPAGQDFLWPGSQIALELFREKGRSYRKAEVLFNSPIVLYSRRMVTDALIKQSIVQKSGDVYYVTNFPKLIRMVGEGTPWKAIGLAQLHGKMLITTTDPSRSNSGNQFAALLASMLNGGEVVEPAQLPAVLPDLKRLFGRLGYMQQSSADLFTQFLQQGVGSYPLIAGYEAQLIEFSIENPQYRDALTRDVTTLYPRPTVWSSHPLISLTPNGDRLLAALQEQDLQELAWKRHGFRSGGIGSDPKLLPVTGVPAVIENVVPMPRAQVMEKIIEALSGV